MDKNISKIAKILKMTDEKMESVFNTMEGITGKIGVAEKIVIEINDKITERRKCFGLNKESSAEEIYEVYLRQMEKTDKNLAEMLENPKFDTSEGCEVLVEGARKTTTGAEEDYFFLKREKAEELLYANPPENVLRFFDCSSIGELLAKVDLMEVFCSLRFAEDMNWLNNIFFRAYKDLKKDDFERRPIKVLVLSGKWVELGEKFMAHKLHNLSHLKELGVLFIIPTEKKFPGQVAETFTLLVHYFHEMAYYSKIIEGLSEKEGFGDKMTSLLKGDVSNSKACLDEYNIDWMIIQRYLAKDNAFDEKLFVPHINPEAIHYYKVERDLKDLALKKPELGLQLWNDQDFVGDYFKKKDGSGEILVSFDIMDHVISLAKKSEAEKQFIYHQQEALWNKILMEYISWEKMHSLAIENAIGGFISFKKQ